MSKKLFVFLIIFTFSGIGFSQISTNSKGEVSFGSTTSKTTNKSTKIVTVKSYNKKVVIQKINSVLGKQTSRDAWSKKSKEYQYDVIVKGNIFKFTAEDKTENQILKNKIAQIKNILDKYKI